MESSAVQDAYGNLSADAAVVPVRAPSKARARGSVLARMLGMGDIAAGFSGALVTLVSFDQLTLEGWAFALITALLWPLSAFSFGLYRGEHLSAWVSSVPEVPRGFVAMLSITWPLYAAAAILGLADAVLLSFVTILATAGFATAARTTIRSGLHRSHELRQRTLILGSGFVAADIVKKLRENDQFGLDPIGLVDDKVYEVGSSQVPWLGRFDDLSTVINEREIDRVIIAFSRASHQELLTSIRICRDAGVAIDVVPRLFEVLDGAPALGQVGGLPLLSIGNPKLTRSSMVAKRALDLTVSALLLLVAAPLMIAIAIAIKIDSRGPVFFRQPRAGRNHGRFEVIKFRSMYVDAEQRKREVAELNDVDDGVMFKIHDDPRITRVGRFIRRFSLDELPQLFNVLTGEMSLVGPRPLIFSEAAALEEAWHRRRLELRPGLTGPWQVYGRSQNPFQEMVRFDYQYVAGWSLARDIEILLGTLPAVLSGRGAY